MARVGDTCVRIGNEDWFRGDSVSVSPTTVAPYDVVRVLRGGSTVISAESSFSEDSLDVIYYQWEVINQPNQTLLQHTGPSLDLPVDDIGEYEIELTAIGANGGCGATVSIFVYSFSGDATQHSATALDTSWVWEMLPSAWSGYNADLRLKSELFWRGLTQIIGSDVTKAIAFDLNKGINTASTKRPARWIYADTQLDIKTCSVVARFVETRDISAYINERHISVSDRFTTNAYVSQLEVIVENSTTLYVSQENGHTPTIFDENSRIQVELNGRVVRRNVIAVDFFDNRSALFTLDDELPNVATGDRLACVLKCLKEPKHNIVASLDNDRGVIFNEPPQGRRVAGNAVALSIVDGFVTQEETSVTQRPYITLKGLWESGVRPGDTINVKVKNKATLNSVDVKLNILDILTGADGLDYVPFAPYSGSFTDVLKGVVTMLIPNVVSIYSEFELLIKNLLTRAAGVPLNAYSEHTVTTSSQLHTLCFEFTHINRRSSLVFDSRVKELSTLREYIELQQTDPTDKYVLTEAKRAFLLGRSPITLLENRDFRVYSEGKKLEGLFFDPTNRYIESPQGDLSYTVRKGYTVKIRSGFGIGSYKVTLVVNNKMYVDPLPSLAFSDADAEVLRAEHTTLVELDSQSALPILSCPPRLWCESATVEDYEEIEAKYGVIAGLLYKDWEELDTSTDYLSIVRGIHICSVKSSSINDLRDLVSIILGIPFIHARSIVRRIDSSARDIDDIIYDKVILEELDRDNEPTGILTAKYIVSSTANNIAKNLGLYSQVRLGQTVEANTVLGRGVNLLDRHSDLPSQRHKFNISIAAGATKLNEKMIKFIRRKVDDLKPAYTDFGLTQQLFLQDRIEIESDIVFRLIKKFTDTPYGLHGPAEVLDDFIPGMGRIDTQPFYVLNTWFPTDGVLSFDVDNRVKLNSDTGGFVQPLESFSRVVKVKVGDELEDLSVSFKGRFDGTEWIKPGDAFIFKTDHEVVPFTILSIEDDNSMTLDTHGVHIIDRGNVSFLIIRFIDDLMLEAEDISMSVDASISLVGQSVHTHNITRGDLVSFSTMGDPARPIRFILNDKIFLEKRGYPALSGEALTGGCNIKVRRPGLSLVEKGTVKITDAGLLGDYNGNIRVLTLPGNAEWLGVSVGDYLDAHMVIGIMSNRRQVCVVMNRDTVIDVDTYAAIRQPRGLLADDALDLAESGVRSSVHIKIKMPNRRFTRIGIDPQGDIENSGGVLDHVSVEQGDIVHIAGGYLATNLGEGLYTYRALNSSSANNGSFSINAPRGIIEDNALNYVEIIRQSPITPYVREG
jgi:hypothetical protein